MTAAVGYGAILVSLVSAALLAVQAARARLWPDSKPRIDLPVWGLLAGAVVAMGALEWALIGHDFSIEYVARNHARATPLVFTIASAWAALEGSIVLWGLVLAGYVAWVYRRVRAEPDALGTVALVVLGLVAVFFFGLMATAGNPFTTLEVVPADGTGPNALLQNNLLMAVHPPLLYLGFVGLTVPFAYGIAALVNGEPGSVWLERTHRTTLVAWTFLTAGIAFGALWSYVVLGWGGYWAWDPVENASFLPWLAATAFIHSAVVQRRRGMLATWNLSLVIATFSLTILGTFLTRSGVVASVHSFTQSAVGPALLTFLVVVVVASLALLATRAHLVASTPRLESLASREGVFLFNNLLLTVWLLAVMIGTLYPILVEAFRADQVSVGRPFFDRATAPIALVLLAAMGLGPVTPYRVANRLVVWSRVRGPLQVALAVTALAVAAGLRSIGALIVVFLASFVVSAVGRHLWHLAARAAGEGTVASAAWRLIQRDRGYWGGQLAHIGVAVAAVAIAVAAPFAERGELTMAQGESAQFGGYTLTFRSGFSVDEGYRTALGAAVEVSRGDDIVTTLYPRLNQYPSQTQAVATPAVKVGLIEDLYVSLTRIDAEGIAVDAFRKPLMWVLWLGGALIVIGGSWAVTAPAAARRREREEVTAP